VWGIVLVGTVVTGAWVSHAADETATGLRGVLPGEVPSGLTAAIAAHEQGAKVAVFEKSDLVGGTTAWSGGQIWIPNNPQMKALEQLKGEFEATHPDIKVNLLILPENEIRAKVTTDVATGAGTFDLITVGMYEVPLWAKQGWIDEVGTTLDADPAYDSADFFQSIRDGLSFEGKLYAAPFYGESSSLFYRKDLFAAAGITLPVKPTWDDVVAAAAKLHKPDQGQYGICLRGLPGWGEQGAPLGTVINTFGGRWYDAGWNAQVTSQQTTDAIKFYIDTVQKYLKTNKAVLVKNT